MLSLFSWSILTTAFSLATVWAIGNKYRLCWHLGLVTQLVYAVYFTDTGQYPGLVTVVLFSALYLRNLRRWRRDSARQAEAVAGGADRVDGDHAGAACPVAPGDDRHA